MGAATLIGARLLQFSAALILFGSPLFYLYGFERSPPQSAVSGRRSAERTGLLIAAGVALFGTLVWLMAETASMGDESSDAINPAALWTVLAATRFGHACLMRIALLSVSIGASLSVPRQKTLWIAQIILGGSVTASFAWTGHGAVDQGLSGAAHLGADLLHLLAAGVWIGALLPLATLVLRSMRSRAPTDVRATQYGLDRFSAIGIWVVALLVFSGLVNSWFLIGVAHWRALITTYYGVVLLIKLGLFGMMLVLAAVNRYRTTPALRADIDEQRSASLSLASLRTTLVTETAMALLVLLAVSLLGTLAPPISGE